MQQLRLKIDRTIHHMSDKDTLIPISVCPINDGLFEMKCLCEANGVPLYSPIFCLDKWSINEHVVTFKTKYENNEYIPISYLKYEEIRNIDEESSIISYISGHVGGTKPRKEYRTIVIYSKEKFIETIKGRISHVFCSTLNMKEKEIEKISFSEASEYDMRTRHYENLLLNKFGIVYDNDINIIKDYSDILCVLNEVYHQGKDIIEGYVKYKKALSDYVDNHIYLNTGKECIQL